MDARTASERTPTKNPTTVERASDRELVIRRTFSGPVRLVFEAWTKPELLKRWWAPRSMGAVLVSCEADVRTGGTYRFEFAIAGDASKTMAFYGKYLEVTPPTRLVWTNEEAGEAGPITTVTFAEEGGKTLLVLRELHPSKEALDDPMASGFAEGMRETFEQLEELLGNDGASASGADPAPLMLAFLSMVDRRKRLHREVTERLQARWSEVLETPIPASAEIERMGLARAAVVASAPRGRAATAYRALWDEVKLRLGEREYPSQRR
ncbi:MAG: SRPBCC domain-containing protein [Acidimicrobiales bacterium]|nr:SRPBCC domain-containing protein [Acidimicrobiales bacterium]